MGGTVAVSAPAASTSIETDSRNFRDIVFSPACDDVVCAHDVRQPMRGTIGQNGIASNVQHCSDRSECWPAILIMAATSVWVRQIESMDG
jgi:hypothetical protein